VVHKVVAAVWRCALALSFAVMAGCGPGTGGTGTGGGGGGGGSSPSPLDYFGATPANICTTGPALALACPVPNNPGAVGAVNPPSVANGTDGVFFSTTDGADINLVLTGNRAILTDRCLSLTFEGDWATVANLDARFFGQYTTANNATAVLSTLTVQAAGVDNKSLSIVLRDANARTVIGPVLLVRVFAPTRNPLAYNR